ncbi:MAG: TRAP transporter substrate-binding protein DctP [Myxococcota bacterium]|nr:TRAP transporter substrate-binding protein DctP [Myxococcota bacterium]
MKHTFAWVLVVALFGLIASPALASTKIKIATLAPDGTTWMKVMKEMASEVEKTTGGQVKLKFYSGGVMGDEGDVIRKMKFGQIHGGAFTGRGLGEISPQERVLELPFLYDNYKELDCVINGLSNRIRQDFEKKGFVLLGWVEAGFVYVFTNKPIHKASDLKGVKMWMWEGDPLAKALFKANGLVPVPLDLPNVLTSMQTGLIDAVYSPPYGVIALQWHSKVKYMLNTKLTFASGAILISKKQFDKLSPEHQKSLLTISQKHCRNLTEQTRKENEEAIAVLKKSGIKIMELASPQELQSVKKTSTSIYQTLSNQLYSPELLTETLKLRDQCRSKN